MTAFDFFCVGRIVFGRQTVNRIGELSAAYGRRALDLLTEARLVLKSGGKMLICQPDLVKIIDVLQKLRLGEHQLTEEQANQLVKNMMAALIWYDEWMEVKKLRYYLCKFPWGTEALTYLLKNMNFNVEVLDAYYYEKHPQYFWRDSIVLATKPKEETHDQGRENQLTTDRS